MRVVGNASKRRLILLSALLLAVPAMLRAQSTAERIQQAIAQYDAFNVEAARPILLHIISPSYLQQVTSQDKALALKYLGASYAVLGSADSAITYFVGALDFDPFTDLDPTKFAASELAAFSAAKARLFKVAMRPQSRPTLVQRDTAAIEFVLITTQRANLQVELAGQRDTVMLYTGPNEGVRTVSWKGILSTGAYAPPGVYQLRVTGRQSGQAGAPPLTETMTLRIEHVLETLEDTLPTLDPARRDLLPERIRPTEPWVDLLKGTALAAVAVGLPLVALETSDIAWAPHAGAAAFVGFTSATISFLYRRKNPQIARNVAENDRRRRERETFNAAVRQRNQRRLDRTLLIISPVTGLGQ